MTITAPAGFTPRNWDAPQFSDVATVDRTAVYDGPTTGSLETVWDPAHGVIIDADGYCTEGQWMVLDLGGAKRLHADLTALLEQLEH